MLGISTRGTKYLNHILISKLLQIWRTISMVVLESNGLNGGAFSWLFGVLVIWVNGPKMQPNSVQRLHQEYFTWQTTKEKNS